MTTTLHTAERRRVVTVVKNIVLFFAAPFVALAYVIAFPFVGLGMLACIGARAAIHHGIARKAARAATGAALMLAAPLIALAYVVLFPFIGLATLAWIGARALMTHEPEKPEAVTAEWPMAA